MAKKRRSKNRKSKNRRPSKRRVASSGKSGVPKRQRSNQSATEQTQHPAEIWRNTREGATASRGFSFQHAICAWIAARIYSGELVADELIPEAFDDIQLERSDPVQFEVKSRQPRMGKFTVGEAAGHVAKAWRRHVERFGTERRLTVVLEQGINGWNPESDCSLSEIPISTLVDEVEGLSKAIEDRMERAEDGECASEPLLDNTTLIFGDRETINAEIERNIGLVTELPPSGLQLIGRNLQMAISDAVDLNTDPDYAAKVGFDRSSIAKRIEDDAELIDVAGVEFALDQNICRPIDKTPVATGATYYDGVSTQPSHVAAGLVVIRPDLVERVMAGLEISRTALLIGPSGVGKSAVLWTLPFEETGILWFRVNRLLPGDVPHIARLVRAYRASPRTPVGMLVDSVGKGDLQSWTELQSTIASVLGAYLVGTARNEDLFAVGDLADCPTVEVSLDEESASRIHAGLVARGSTAAPHWVEAFEQSSGLTLEFTHQLTRGTRLDRIIADQIETRLSEDRHTELEILALVSTADRWSARLSVEEVENAIDATAWKTRASLNRLVKEHLVVERDGNIEGLHQIRSRAINDAVHEIPGVSLENSVLCVLGMLSGPALSNFIYEVLREEPRLEQPVIAKLKSLVEGVPELLAPCLRGLELADYWAHASQWVEVAQTHGVPPAQMSLTFLSALAGIEWPEFLMEQVLNAVDEMRDVPEVSRARKALINDLGIDAIALRIRDTTDRDERMALLSSIRGATDDWGPLSNCLESGSPFLRELNSCSFAELTDYVSGARAISREFAVECVDSIGGNALVLQRLMDDDPLIVEAEVVQDKGISIGRAVYLPIDIDDENEANERSVAVSRSLLRSLPQIDKVDVTAYGFDERESGQAEFAPGSSGLLRENDHHPVTIQRHHDRMRFAHTLFGASETDRLAAANALFSDVADVIRDIGNASVRASLNPKNAMSLIEKINELESKGRQISPSLGNGSLESDGTPALYDPLPLLIIQICGNVLPRFMSPGKDLGLSLFIRDTILGQTLPAVRSQRWQLLGFDGAPESLGAIADALADLEAVLSELTAFPSSGPNVQRIAKSGPTAGALSRAANLCCRRANRRTSQRAEDLMGALKEAGADVRVYSMDTGAPGIASDRIAIAVEVVSMEAWSRDSDEVIMTLQNRMADDETILVLPLLGEQMIADCAVSVGKNGIRPVTDFGDFATRLPPEVELKLTSGVKKAYVAMQRLSQLSVVCGKADRFEGIRNRRQGFVDEIRDALVGIGDLKRDQITSDVLSLSLRDWESVEGEWSGDVEPGTFATNFEDGSLEVQSELMSRFQSTVMLAIEWDLNPENAQKFY